VATPVPELARITLPTRIRSKRAAADGLASRLALADRIAALPCIETAEDHQATLPRGVEVYLRAPCASLRRQHAPVLLCCIHPDGIVLFGLSDSERYQVMVRGWCRLSADRIHLFPPRDDDELEVCWDILQRAYRTLLDASATTAAARTRVRPADLPSFSRTTLQ